MKWILLVLPFFLLEAKAESLAKYRFVTVKRYTETSSLPPKLELTFDLLCNEQFVKVIRQEGKEKKSIKKIIAVGVLVKENPMSGCAAKTKEMTVPAGNTYSGRPFAVVFIQK